MTVVHQRWVVAIETLSFAALAAWLLSQQGNLLDPFAWLVAGVIIVAGDCLTVFVMGRFARSRILVEPAENERNRARAIDDFDGNGVGTVLLRGERWRARTECGSALRAGESVEIVSRAGLELVVRRLRSVALKNRD